MADFEIFGPYAIALLMGLGSMCVFAWGVLAGAFGHADDAVHESEVAAIEPLVGANFAILAGPAARHGDRGDAEPARRDPAQDVRLVAVAKEDGIRLPDA